MKKIVITCILAMLLTLWLPAYAADGQENISISAGCNTLDAGVPLLGGEKLVNNGKSMLLYETATDTLMYAYNADEKISPASFVKILTALIAIEKGQMDDAVTVGAADLATLPDDAMVVGLKAGEVLTVEDLLYCILVGSGNDAAAVLATHISGSQQAFVDEMNAYATEHGCANTVFVNAHGLHSSQQYTTARDFAKILANALNNETFCKIFGAKTYTVPETNISGSRKLFTQNSLIYNGETDAYYDNRVTGSRTGATNDRLRNVASVAEDGDMRVICIVMGCQSEYEADGYSTKVYGGYRETTQLLNYAFSGYKAVQLLHPEQIVKQSNVPNGDALLSVGAKDGAFSVIPSQPDALTYRYINEPELTAPIEKGQTIGVLQIWCGNVCIAQTELLSMNSVAISGSQFGEDGSRRQGGVLQSAMLTMLGVVLAVVLIFVAVLCLMRWGRIINHKARSRRKNKALIRSR